MLLVAGMLSASLPSFRPLRAPEAAPRPFRLGLFAAPLPAPSADDPFNPVRIAFGTGELPPMAPLPPPDAETDALRPLPPPRPAFTAPAPPPPVGLPVAAMRSSLSPAPPLFSRPNPVAPAAPPPPPSGTVTLFHDAGSVLPTVIVDAPGAPPEFVRSVEAAALARRTAPDAASAIVRLPVSQLVSAPSAGP